MLVLPGIANETYPALDALTAGREEQLRDWRSSGERSSNTEESPTKKNEGARMMDANLPRLAGRMLEEVPRMRVYKFLTSEFAMKDIWERRLKISEISDLNDPFELIPCDLSDPKHLFAILATRDEMTRNRGLLCFSRAWTDPVLWAHYADKHRGLCLGFDIPNDTCRAVDYVEERLPWEAPSQKFMEKLLWTKFARWSYEGEIRAFVTREEQEDGHFFFHIGENLALREIIVGHRCCVERGQIAAAMAAYPDQIPIRKARLSRTSFGVEENPYGFMS